MAEKFLGKARAPIGKLVGELLIKGLAEAIVTLVLLAASGIFSAKKLFHFYEPAIAYQWQILSIITVLSFYIAVLVYRKLNRFRPRFAPVHCEFKIVSLVITFKFTNENVVEYRRQYELEVLKGPQDRFTDRFRWSGTGKPQMQSLVPNHELFAYDRESLYDYFDIRFPRAYNANEILKADVAWTIDDGDRSAAPFFSRTIHEPTDSLTFVLDASQIDRTRMNVFFDIAPDISSPPRHRKTNSVKFRNGIAKFRVDSPKLLHHYQLRWTRNGLKTHNLSS